MLIFGRAILVFSEKKKTIFNLKGKREKGGNILCILDIDTYLIEIMATCLGWAVVAMAGDLVRLTSNLQTVIFGGKKALRFRQRHHGITDSFSDPIHGKHITVSTP